MNGTIITKKGLHLLTKLVAAETPLIFTRAAVGTGKLLQNYDPSMMLDLIEYKMDGTISSCSASGEEASVIFQISSAGIDEGFFISEAGLYAEDPDEGEILYAYVDMSSDTQYIYAQNDEISKFVEITLIVIIGAAKNVTAYISPSSMITKKAFDEKISQLETPDFDDSGEVEGIESFVDFMSLFVSGTSQDQFLANLKAGLKYVLHAGQLVNSGMCETPGMFALDAAYGKTLTDQITGLYSDISVRYNADTDHIQIHNGIEWIDWLSVGLLFDGYLYNRGIYSEYFTGFTGNATVSNNADNINIKVGPLSGTNYAIVTSNEIDFSKFNKIQINAKSSVYDASSYYTDIQILDKNQNVVAQKRLSNSANTIEIDITNVTNGYIAIKSYLYNITLTFDNIIYSIKLKRTI